MVAAQDQKEARSQNPLNAAELEHVMSGNTVRFHNLATGRRALACFDPDDTALVGDEYMRAVDLDAPSPGKRSCPPLSVTQRARWFALDHLKPRHSRVPGRSDGRVRSVCISFDTRTHVASVMVDAYRALDFLAANPRVDASRIAILGASFGGRTALWTSSIRFRERYSPSRANFAAHLAFYPAACWITLADEVSVSGVPIRIFHGTADERGPIGPCRAYVERLRRAGKDAALLEYPGAPHSFDAPGAPPFAKSSARVITEQTAA
jgi:dienelactone hydrolase